MLPQAVTVLKRQLHRCGYAGPLLKSDYRVGDVAVPLAGFAHEPFDALSACVAATDAPGEPAQVVAALRDLGAPIVFVLRDSDFQWWRQAAQEPRLEHRLPLRDVPRFFEDHAADFAPDRVYRAKTFGRFDASCQLGFVDVGLMPLVEHQLGRKLTDLVEQLVQQIQSHFHQRRKPGVEFGRWLFKSAFWLLAAKLLKDKRVPAFAGLDLGALDEAFNLVGVHYGAAEPFAVGGRREREALVDAARTLCRFASLEHVTTEALAYVYESALVDTSLRQDLGIHSTPPYLVDYIVWRLEPWIRQIAVDERRVFEPAAGHAGFLVAAMRVLRELLPRDWTAQKRRRYLRERLRGVEIDPFALEVARLSLTLADVPQPDGWQLTPADMFSGNRLAEEAARSSIVLSNPPFENFHEDERARYEVDGCALHANKATEMLARMLPHLPPGAVCGLVLPRGLLHGTDALAVRHQLVHDFELMEVCVFPDKVFRFSDAESAVILARRRPVGGATATAVCYRRVREHDVDRFQQTYEVTSETRVSQARFAESGDADLRVRELADVWAWCARYPTLGALASVGKGFEYKSRANLPEGAESVSSRRFAGAVRGYWKVDAKLLIHGQARLYWMNLHDAVVRRAGTGTTRERPQVLLNYAPVRRGPWRLKAVVDQQGHPVTSRFLTVRPEHDQPLEFFWALLNSPVANAWAFDCSSKRETLVRDVRRMPVPPASSHDCQRIAAAARRYIDAASGDLFTESKATDSSALRELLLQIDAEILALYDLPPRLERQLLDVFTGHPRLGVPCEITRYYAADFESYIPLKLYLSDVYRRSTVEQLLARNREPAPTEVLAALDRAAEAFRE